MATIAFQMIGSELGGFFGGSVGGAFGSAIGGTLGSMVDRSLLGGGATRSVEGPRLTNSVGISAQEGASIPRIYGRVRVGGHIIWATEYEEERTIETSGSSGGKSSAMSAGSSTPKTKTTRYSYYANFAVGLCEGSISFVRRIWADGAELDLSTLNFRVYTGAEDQDADPLIVAKQGSGDIPAFRGIAYIVFERMPLARYGNRLPQMSFEVVRAASNFNNKLKAINLIPGSTEFGYSLKEVREDFGYGSSQSINRSQLVKNSDWQASFDDLRALLPNLERATLISAWFGDDLRAGQCTLRPKVEKHGKVTTGEVWEVVGLSREQALAVSQTDNAPSYGGSPSDASIIAAIRDIKSYGIKVSLHPFILMDIPHGNVLPEPSSDNIGQPALIGQPVFPWRGRIVPDDNSPFSVDAQIGAFLGSASAQHFFLSGDKVIYNGPQEWSFRRMILHNAMLAKAAGGVDAFIISSELIGLTRTRGSDGSFPFINGLIGLLEELRTILGQDTLITYAADWSEYGAFVEDGGKKVSFPLDAFWAHNEVGAIAIDYYPPLTDWREGVHIDLNEGWDGPSDISYIRSKLRGGEDFDWYYADYADRALQNRKKITDGDCNKPWVYRAKDLWNWWANPHYERVGGIEKASHTAFIPQSKPIIFSEIGCPAVDKGGNQPNAFPDLKSSEALLPYFSNGGRDDFLQRNVLDAIIGFLDSGDAAFRNENNPTSNLYSGRMIDTSFIAPWAYDMRPFPAFPTQSALWADGKNWARGHWLNGRLEGMPIADLLQMVAEDYGIDVPITHKVEGMIDGYIIDRPMSVRSAIEPIVNIFGLNARIDGDKISFIGRSRQIQMQINEEMLVPQKDGARMEITRRQESELPKVFRLGYIETEVDFRQSVSVAEVGNTSAIREHIESSVIHISRSQANKLAAISLATLRQSRETFRFSLPYSMLSLEVGDVVKITTDSGSYDILLTRITDGTFRECEGTLYEPELADFPSDEEEYSSNAIIPSLPGKAFFELLELPIVSSSSNLISALLRADPWHGPYSLFQRKGGSGYMQGESLVLASSIENSARIGVTLSDFPPGPLWRWDNQSILEISLTSGALSSLAEKRILAGENAIALIHPDNSIEIVLFRDAILIGEGIYNLSGFIRGVGMTERFASRNLPAGSKVVVLDDSLVELDGGLETIGMQRIFTAIPFGRDAASDSAVTDEITANGVALRPLAPVHLRAIRKTDGVYLTFFRRARVGGDNFDLFEVPLSETKEEYELKILKQGVVCRTITLSGTQYLYSPQDEIADFGALQNEISIEVRQMSFEVGLGDALIATVPIN